VAVAGSIGVVELGSTVAVAGSIGVVELGSTVAVADSIVAEALDSIGVQTIARRGAGSI